MANNSSQPNASRTRLIAIAWVVTLLVSWLADILFYELAGTAPLWLLWAKAGLLGALLLLGWAWRPLGTLRPFFLTLLAITALMRANAWLLDTSAWVAWQHKQPFAIAAMTAQLFEMAVALLLIGLLFLLRKRRQRFFLVWGDRPAVAEPIGGLGRKSPSPLWRFGLVFTLVVMIAQVLMLILPLSPAAGTLRRFLPLVPLVLLLAASNSFNEEIILRAAPISPVYEVVGGTNAIWMAAVLFGLSHYIGGIPSGIPGVLITAVLGWFFGKCMLDSKGFFWPWLFHAVQDILPFTLMALSAIS